MVGEPRLIRAGLAADIPPGTGRVIDTPGPPVAIFNVGGTYHAVDNACPHRGGPLGEGDLRGTVVTCPWHGWDWDVTTGANANNPGVRVACHPVTEREGVLFVLMAP